MPANVQALGLPGVLAYPLYVKLLEKGTSGISKEDLLSWIRENHMIEVPF